GPHLATVHAQSESLLSFDATSRLGLLDLFAGTQIDATSQAFSKWKGIQTRIEELERDEQDRLRLVDLWSFQKHEIEEAKLQRGEDERLETEKRVLANAEKIYGAAMNAFDLLYQGDASTSASLRAAQKHIEELAEAGGEYLRAAHIISKKRYEAARKLEKLVESEINDLAMRSNFRIEVSGTDEEGNWTSCGFDQVLYLISTNPGEPLRPLEQI